MGVSGIFCGFWEMTHGIVRLLLALGLVWYLPGTQALALSELELSSALNQPFSVRVELLYAQPEEIANLTVHIGDPASTAGPRLPLARFLNPR